MASHSIALEEPLCSSARMFGNVTVAETPSALLWRLARLKLAFRSAFKE